MWVRRPTAPCGCRPHQRRPEPGAGVQPDHIAAVPAAASRILHRPGGQVLQHVALVIYTSDNGMMWSAHGLLDKRYPYAPSVHVPLFVRWPGHVTAGATSSNMVANIDVAPTILDATGTSFDPSQIDGHDLLGPYVRTRMHLVLGEPGRTRCPDLAGDVDQQLRVRAVVRAEGEHHVPRVLQPPERPLPADHLLHDGTTANDPKTAPLQAQVNADQTCAGASCP
jgi:arylsulfatase A-like enzyme